MKKILLYTAFASLTFFTSCRKDEVEVIPITTQNSYDDEAAERFITEHYFDDQGNVLQYSSSSTADDNIPSIATFPKEKLPSGVIIITRPTAQPNPGKAIGSTDILTLMHRTISYVARKGDDGVVKYQAGSTLINTMNGSGVPERNPFFYYAGSSVRKGQDRSFFEIEGFREAIQKFRSCEIPETSNYNLQGVIIVPSRAAFARDKNVFDQNPVVFHDRSFVFNFQVYKTEDRPTTDL